MRGTSSMRRHDRPCVCASSRWTDCTKDQVADNGQGSYVRALCDADMIELHRRWPPEATVACLVAIDGN